MPTSVPQGRLKLQVLAFPHSLFQVLLAKVGTPQASMTSARMKDTLTYPSQVTHATNIGTDQRDVKGKQARAEGTCEVLLDKGQ